MHDSCPILDHTACIKLHKIKMRGTLETVKSTFITSHEVIRKTQFLMKVLDPVTTSDIDLKKQFPSAAILVVAAGRCDTLIIIARLLHM